MTGCGASTRALAAPDDLAVNTLDDVGVRHQAASLLLAYPDQQLLDRLPPAGGCSATPASHFDAVLAHLEGQSLVESQTFHVAEFDTSRRHALHLELLDRRRHPSPRRGAGRHQAGKVYRDSGLLVQLDGELPDHLPLVLEFAAIGDPERGRALLQRYSSQPFELLRLQLVKDELPHAGVLEAVCATLPGDSPTSRAEVQKMYDAAMPSETVGLDGGYGDGPLTTERRAPEMLGMPTIPTPSAAEPITTTAEPAEAPSPSLFSRLPGRPKEKK